jgi:nicotinamide-nucleotide amidase
MDPTNPSAITTELQETAQSLGSLLLEHGEKIVFAESCTAGLAAASLAIVPGISRCLCGSLVTYREASKTAWLGVDAKLIGRVTAVSPEVTVAMACGALRQTAEANWAAAVTGHLGPDAPPEQDGTIHIAIARRLEQSPPHVTDREMAGMKLVTQLKPRLTCGSRILRQQQAAQLVLATLEQALRSK